MQVCFPHYTYTRVEPDAVPSRYKYITVCVHARSYTYGYVWAYVCVHKHTHAFIQTEARVIQLFTPHPQENLTIDDEQRFFCASP